MTKADKIAVRDAKRAKRNAKRNAKRAKKQRNLESRTALSVRNIQENIAIECSRAIHRAKSARSYCLKTPSELLEKVVAINPPKESNGH
jgi:hypothetical protein